MVKKFKDFHTEKKNKKPVKVITPEMSNSTLGRLAKNQANEKIGKEAAAELAKRRLNQTPWIPKELLAAIEIDPRWKDSLFAQLKLLPAKQKGMKFEQIASSILASRGYDIGKRGSSDYDFVMNGKKCELKGSTTTKGSEGSYSFLQIRPDQKYDSLILMTIHFSDTITFYEIPKADILKLIDAGVFKKQHGGNKAESRTFCYNGPVDRFEKYKFYTWHRAKKTSSAE